MFREIIPITLSLAIALAGGIYATDQITSRFEGFGALQIGDWTAYLSAGSINADPYARARAARGGRIALGSAEGLAFIAKNDSEGQPLRAQCRYKLSGKTAAARAWTLRVTDDQLIPIAVDEKSAGMTHSGSILRKSDGSFDIQVSPLAGPGNWVQTTGNGMQFFVMTLYDTSVASNTGISDYTMPSIDRLSCDD